VKMNSIYLIIVIIDLIIAIINLIVII